jgi:hypothetical protein
VTREEEIERRLEGGTEGPLFVHDFSEIGGEVTVSCDHPATITVATMDNGLTGALAEKQANAEMFANAPSDLRYLLDKCKRLEGATISQDEAAFLLKSIKESAHYRSRQGGNRDFYWEDQYEAMETKLLSIWSPPAKDKGGMRCPLN